MTRYIDADCIIAALKSFNDRAHGSEHFFFGLETAKELIECAPTANVAPVVHGEWHIVEYEYLHLAKAFDLEAAHIIAAAFESNT